MESPDFRVMPLNVSSPCDQSEVGHCLMADAVGLQPHDCALGPAGRRPTAIGARAVGVWRGVAVGESVDVAASVALFLGDVVSLDSRGVCAAVTGTSQQRTQFKFVPAAFGDVAIDEGAVAFGGHIKTFCLHAAL